MNKYLKKYLLHARDIKELYSHQSLLFCIKQTYLWVSSFRINLQRACYIYSVKKHNHILKKLSEKYDYLIPSYIDNYDCKCAVENLPIWLFWYQGEQSMPSLVQMCIKSIKKNANGRPVYFLHKDNIEDYITLPKYIYDGVKNKYISLTHLSDLIRVQLLYQYGGTWLDATLYVTSPLTTKELNSHFDSIKIHPLENDTISNYRWTGFYLFSRPNSIAMKCFRDIMFKYWEDGNRGLIDYFFIDYTFVLLYNKCHDFRDIIDNKSYGNEQIYELARMLNTEYTHSCMEQLNGSSIFKLNWRFIPDEGNTIFKYLIENT